MRSLAISLTALVLAGPAQALPPGVDEAADRFDRWSPAADVPLDIDTVLPELLEGTGQVVMPGQYSLDGLPLGPEAPPAAESGKKGDSTASGTVPDSPPADDPPAGIAADWQTYTNARFGTTIDYPAARFDPMPPPQNGDGRSFEARDGGGSFAVWGSYNALEDTPAGRMGSYLAEGGFQEIRSAALTPAGDGFTAEAVRDGRLILHSELFRAGTIHGFQADIAPAADAAPYRRIMDSLRAVAVSTDTPLPTDLPVIVPKPEPPAATLPPPPTGGYYTPARGTAERSQIMDAAREVIVPELGQRVIFLVSTLRSDGRWAYLSAEPLQPNGQPLNWLTTPYAADWRADLMSDLVMVLLVREAGGWRAIDYVIGPTDVHWYGWIDLYGLPERLFHGG
ncbi:hypothetical protein P1J78_01315 [Psychromarinibacter sp. C21-152]|uniref:Uncharacterized protein n=1 Tax=Psychromarinibacter sediminicola TaxID=3033385 RepID=A0AAE3T6J6_9RHOB|nr:hypothetical protein [Psychromarinibacter sediminicola]MDF0599360.1 hypothetical protein [Psychromarinibacter sediminicola]